MRIGYDAKRAFLNNTGLGNYSRWLIKSLAHYYPDNAYMLYTPKVRPNRHVDSFSGFNNVQTLLPKNKAFTSWWRSKTIVNDLQRDGISIYHGLSHELPYRIDRSGIPSIVTIHDLIFLRFPQYFGRVSRTIYKAKLKYACRVADKIIAVSDRTRKDLIELLNIAPSKIRTVYQGCNATFKKTCTPAQIKQVLNKYKLTEGYVLNVGTIEERKNLEVLVEAMAQVNNQTRLVVVGRQTGYAEVVKRIIHRYRLTDRMIFLDDINFNDLPALYQGAGVFVYPSRYEGFGIPVLEALCSGTPVIAATGSCLEEAGGPDSLYINPDNPTELAQKINRVLNDDMLRARMISNGKEYARRFDDDKLATEMMDVYRQIIK